MANLKISQLPAITAVQLAAPDLFVVADISANTTKKITYAEMLAALGGVEIHNQWFTLSAGDITAKQVTLEAVPPNANKVIIDWAGAGAQEFGVDYTIAAAVLDWNGLALDGVLVAGSRIRAYWVVSTAPIHEQWFTLSAGDITAKQVTLESAPADANKVLVDWAGSGPQELGTDFDITGTTLDWNGFALDGALVAGSRLRTFWID